MAEQPRWLQLQRKIFARFVEQRLKLGGITYKVNDVVEGTNFPRVPDDVIHNIIYENWKLAFEA